MLNLGMVFTVAGLATMAFAVGGIFPCKVAVGADQFILPDHARIMNIYFSIYYMSINAGTLVAMFTTPILRGNFTCFGLIECYALAFGVPTVLLSVGLSGSTKLSAISMNATFVMRISSLDHFS